VLHGIFGSGEKGRVFVRPGMQVPGGVLDAHAKRHQAVAGEHLAGQTTNFVIYSDGSPDGDAAAQAMLEARRQILPPSSSGLAT